MKTFGERALRDERDSRVDASQIHMAGHTYVHAVGLDLSVYDVTRVQILESGEQGFGDGLERLFVEAEAFLFVGTIDKRVLVEFGRVRRRVHKAITATITVVRRR